MNNVMPGYTRTARVAALAARTAELEGTAPDAEYATWESQIPMRRLGEPAEFGRAAAFLLSPAASFVSGAMLPVDGGMLRSL